MTKQKQKNPSLDVMLRRLAKAPVKTGGWMSAAEIVGGSVHPKFYVKMSSAVRAELVEVREPDEESAVKRWRITMKGAQSVGVPVKVVDASWAKSSVKGAEVTVSIKYNDAPKISYSLRRGDGLLEDLGLDRDRAVAQYVDEKMAGADVRFYVVEERQIHVIGQLQEAGS